MTDITEIKDETRQGVIVKLSPGKQYLSSTEPEIQHSQKGPTCWFYAYNYLRLRLGSDFEQEYDDIFTLLMDLKKTEPKEVFDFLNEVMIPLKLLRKKEKIISSYRKIVTHSSELEDLRKQICGSKDNEPIAKLKLNPSDSTSEVEKDFYAYVAEFRNQQAITSFKEFLTLKINELQNNAAIDVFEKLNNPQALEMVKQIENESPAHLKAPRMQSLVRLIGATQLGLKKSKFKHTDNIDQLIETITTEGAIVIASKEAPVYYELKAAQQVKDHNDANYKIFSLPPSRRLDAKEIEQMNYHAVVIVGAEKGIGNNIGSNYVYFIDPNYQSIPGQEQKVFKAPFESFKAHMQKSTNFCADTEKNNTLIERYNAMKETLNYQPKARPKKITVNDAPSAPTNPPLTTLDAIKELALGILPSTIIGSIAVALLSTITPFCFFALPVCMIIGTIVTVIAIAKKDKQALLTNNPTIATAGKSSTAAIANHAKFSAIPTHDLSMIVAAQSDKSAPIVASKTAPLVAATPSSPRLKL